MLWAAMQHTGSEAVWFGPSVAKVCFGVLQECGVISMCQIRRMRGPHLGVAQCDFACGRDGLWRWGSRVGSIISV